MPKKVCVVVFSRANYARSKSILQAIKNHQDLTLQLVVGGSALLAKYGEVYQLIKKDGFEIDAKCRMVIEGELPVCMAKSTGLGIIELSSIFEQLAPDMVVTIADRYETLSTAVASTYMNIPLAHIQGGEETGSIDESVRHAITKLAHLHFPATQLAAKNIMRMGEDESSIFVSGCPSLDLLYGEDLTLPPLFFSNQLGAGHSIDQGEPYIVVAQHPVTTEYLDSTRQIEQTLKAVEEIGLQVVWLWPNIDAGSDSLSKKLRQYRERNPDCKIRFFRNFDALDYAKLINNSACLLGNSSSAIREGAFLGVPAVNIGTRQKNREMADNVISVDYASEQIIEATRKQIQHGRYDSQTLYGAGNAGEIIACKLASNQPFVQKQLAFE